MKQVANDIDLDSSTIYKMTDWSDFDDDVKTLFPYGFGVSCYQ